MTTTAPVSIEARAAEFREKFAALREEIGKVIVGQRHIIDEVLIAAITDAWPPAVFSRLEVPVGVPTVDLDPRAWS